MLLDALEGVCQKPYKNRFFLSTLLLDAEETEKQEEKERPKISNTHFLGGLENGQEVVTPFFFPKIGFFKILKNPIFIVFPEKMGGKPFFSKKAMLQGGHM